MKLQFVQFIGLSIADIFRKSNRYIPA